MLLNTFCGYTQHLLNFTDAQHRLCFHCSSFELFSAPTVCSAPELFSAPTDYSEPKHFYLTHNGFCICSALTEKSTRHELTCLTPTNEFSQALQTTSLQLILALYYNIINQPFPYVLLLHLID